MDDKSAPQQEATAEPTLTVDSLQRMEETIARFQRRSVIAGAHDTAQRAYNKFCANRTAQLPATFFELVDVPDLSRAAFNPQFKACVPTGGSKDDRFVEGMEQAGRCHGVIRYEYKSNIIEECHMDGSEHGLRVVFTQVGQIWIRLYSNGQRLAQIVLNGDYTVASMPKPIDQGGLVLLWRHLDLIVDCFKAK